MKIFLVIMALLISSNIFASSKRLTLLKTLIEMNEVTKTYGNISAENYITDAFRIYVPEGMEDSHPKYFFSELYQDQYISKLIKENNFTDKERFKKLKKNRKSLLTNTLNKGWLRSEANMKDKVETLFEIVKKSKRFSLNVFTYFWDPPNSEGWMIILIKDHYEDDSFGLYIQRAEREDEYL
ncbi:MAG: hypothetical protein HON90_11755 [Halobacteriovoraceae bacterium]|jgi:hypothetical protein|nr:hypothetical protein [Halobacteriovoraceae bacterium]